jgi:multidrug resistance efflux pump
MPTRALCFRNILLIWILARVRDFGEGTTAEVRQLEAEIRAGDARILTHKYQVATAEHKITQLRAAFVAVNYEVRILGQDVQAGGEKVSKVNSELEYAKIQQQRYQSLAQQNAGPAEDAQTSAQLFVESDVIKVQTARIANRINLHLALGGSFEAVPSIVPIK